MKNNNIYISDLLSVHAPRHTTSRQEYLRHLMFRRLLWSCIPVLGQIVLALLACGGTILFVMALSLGVGG